MMSSNNSFSHYGYSTHQWSNVAQFSSGLSRGYSTGMYYDTRSNRSPTRIQHQQHYHHTRRDSVSSSSSTSTSPRSTDDLELDVYLDPHLCHNEEDPDNPFDFVLLPGTMNARRGMKTANPESIPCKYGNSCFKKDCPFAHASELYTGPTTNAPRALSRSSAADFRSRSPASISSGSGSEPLSPPKPEERYTVVF